MLSFRYSLSFRLRQGLAEPAEVLTQAGRDGVG
jgi:hypothetical protein